MKYRFVLIFSCLLFAALPRPMSKALADSWRMPKQGKYCSRNKKFCLEVTPKQLESQLKYFQDKANQSPNAGVDKATKENLCKGKFLVRNSLGILQAKADFPLANEVAPVEAIVSDDGAYFVTFDNWHSVGYGDDVVAIYRANGSLIRKLALEEIFTQNDIGTFSESTSSRHWGRDHYFDLAKNNLILRAVTNRNPLYDDNAEFREVRIDLASGNRVGGKKDILPRREFRIEALNTPSQVDGTANTPQLPWRCLQDGIDPKAINATPLTEAHTIEVAIQKPLPVYPPIGRAAAAVGDVITDFLVSESGDVLCAQVLQGHPLLREAAIKAALQWRFTAGSEKRLGRVSFSFQRVFVDPLESTNNRK